MITRFDALNDALERLSDYAFLDGPGFACHGPMGAETLSTLGHDDLVAGWVDEYRARHEPIPAPPTKQHLDPSDADGVRSALGDVSRVSDWAAMFRAQLWEQPWQVVIDQWVPRLWAGYAGALTHGLIRTAHAVRAMPTESQPSALQLDELASGLGLWAASYKTLPGEPALRGTLTLAAATASLPRPSEPWPILEAGTFARIDELHGFTQAVEALGRPTFPDDSLTALSAHFCRLLLAHRDVFAVPLVHTVTPIAAGRTLLPHLSLSSVDNLFAQLWHVGAAITVSFSPVATRLDAEPDHDPGGIADLLARAAEHQDPHVLKFSEACAREYALNPDLVYLAAAAHVIGQLPAWRA